MTRDKIAERVTLLFSLHSSKRTNKRILIFLLAGVLGAGNLDLFLLAPPAVYAAEVKKEQSPAPQGKKLLEAANEEAYYSEQLKAWRDQGAKAAAAPLELNAAEPSDRSDDAKIYKASYEGKDNVLLWNDTGEQWVEYRFDVPSDGLYEISVSYHPVTGKGLRRPIIWDVKADGIRPFREASSITLYRQWKDARPIKKDEEGDEIRPKSEEISAWSEKPLSDSGGAYAEPLQWFFNKGSHTLRFQGSEPIALEKIKLTPSQKLKPYAEVAAIYPKTKPVQTGVQTLQAEEVQSKSDSSIQLVSDQDQRSVPLAKGKITFNSIGGRKWWNQNQEISWTFQVPEAGAYSFAFRTLQNFFSQKSSFRTIRIDGKVPFEELTAYRFPYSVGWKGNVLQDQADKPYEFYLEKGEHTISMAVTNAPFTAVIQGIDEVMALLRDVDQDLKSLTGGQKDKNRTWKIEQDLPDLPKTLEQTAEKIEKLSVRLKEANGRPDSISQGFDTTVSDIKKMLKKVDDIPYHADQISSMEEKIGNSIDTLQQQPLQLDEIYIAPAGQKFSGMEASLLAKIKGVFANFYYTFQSRNLISKMNPDVLNVWVHRGRDYVTQLQDLADEMFTPDTGIRVKVNLLPNPQLLVLSNAAGIQPDVALGLSQDLPVDYAVRNSVCDLSKFQDFREIYKQFSPGSWVPFYYNKGYYAVPETQSFQIMYYRKDILGQLGVNLPDTWEDVYNLLPTLQQNQMNFYVNPKEFAKFFYQNHAEFFSKDGSKSELSTPEGFKAFKQWTDLFNTYAIEREVPSFYQHFRDGSIPIGIADYNMYIQLSTAAPELNGRWGIALIPGIKQADGTISRWSGGGQNTGMIFNTSTKKDQAWEFMKWWVSADVQERYGSELEAANGISFRWNTANIHAFSRLPWNKEDANIIFKQWQWYKEIPNLPGGYFLVREINNAWNRTVVDGMNYRTSLEMAVMDIDRELKRKQHEFGFIDDNGNQVKSMELPVVNQPWEGVKSYVK